MTKIVDIETKQEYEINAPKYGENYLQCPKCSATRRKKQEKCFMWNTAKGVGHCYHCNTSFKEFNPFMRKQQEKDYYVPQWKNITDLSDKAVGWFTGRHISQATLAKMRIYSDREFMPQYGKEVEVICFPYFRDGKLVNVKYRASGKKFKMVKDAELIFYNIDSLKDHPDNLIIVEGEMDALSWIEAGYYNVISVPNGASGNDLSYLDGVIDDLNAVSVLYIASDQDAPGVKLRNELIRRLGPEKCRIVTYDGYKDSNELFADGGVAALRNALEKSYSPPIPGVFDLPSYYDEIRLIFENGLDVGKQIGLKPVDDLIKWGTGMLAVWTGIPSHGKSEMINFMVANWCVKLGWKTAFFSPENIPYTKHLYPKLASVIVGNTFRKGFISDDDYDEVFDFICDNFKFIDAGNDYTVETVISAAENLVKRYGIKVLVIDPYNCFEHTRKNGESETEYIGRFLDSLVRFAKRYDVLVNLVAHPRKMERAGNNKSYLAPSLYDISGSANFYNKADIGITVFRRFEDNAKGPGTEFTVTKVRFKEFGKTGTCDLQYNFRNGRYAIPVNDIHLLDNSNYLRKPAVELIAASNTYTNDDECPF